MPPVPIHPNLQNEMDYPHIEPGLPANHAHLTRIIAFATDVIITVDEEQHILLFNAAAEKVFGYPAAEILGKPLDLLLPERYRLIHRQHIHHFGNTGVTNRKMGRLDTLFALRANGEEFPIEASISQAETAGSRFYTVILRDITERVAAEEKLVESEQQLRATFDQAAVGIAHLSPDGHWLRANQKLCEITGYTEAELQELSIQKITCPEDLNTTIELQGRLLAGQIQTYTLEKRFVRKDNSLVWVSLTASLVRDSNKEPKYFIKIIEDITQRKEAEAALRRKTDEIKAMSQQLWQTARLATMGELAASVAHELNNPLAILSLRIESLEASLPPTSSEQRELKVMAEEVERMASLVTNLLQFSRSGQRQISSLSLSEEADKTLELTHNHLLHRHITVQREYDASTPLVQADRQQLRQLFLNLITNAGDAMPEGGVLTIHISPLENERRVKIEIRDTGIGIRAEDLPLIMDPFYTTKVEGKGTGLGLAICRRIVEEHSGSIHITSAGSGKGACVQVILPACNESKPNFLEE